MLPQTPILADGYRSRNRKLYRLDETGLAHEYVSDAMREEAKRVNRDVEWMANDKSVLQPLLGPCGDHAVTAYGMIVKGDYLSLGASWRDVERVLRDGALVVAKPRFGADGFGIKVFDDPKQMPILMSLEDHVITAFVRQAKYADHVWSQSTNTIRVFTMHAPDEPNFIAAAVHRFGTAESSPTDNWEQGGLSASIDMKTGELGMAARTYGDGALWFSRHPTTAARIRGLQIPGWEDVKALALDMAAEVYDLAHIGWDFVVTPDGPVVLEMNANCGVCAIQVHGGLLRDKRVRAFYAAHEIGLPCQAITTR